MERVLNCSARFVCVYGLLVTEVVGAVGLFCTHPSGTSACHLLPAGLASSREPRKIRMDTGWFHLAAHSTRVRVRVCVCVCVCVRVRVCVPALCHSCPEPSVLPRWWLWRRRSSWWPDWSLPISAVLMLILTSSG